MLIWSIALGGHSNLLRGSRKLVKISRGNITTTLIDARWAPGAYALWGFQCSAPVACRGLAARIRCVGGNISRCQLIIFGKKDDACIRGRPEMIGPHINHYHGLSSVAAGGYSYLMWRVVPAYGSATRRLVRKDVIIFSFDYCPLATDYFWHKEWCPRPKTSQHGWFEKKSSSSNFSTS